MTAGRTVARDSITTLHLRPKSGWVRLNLRELWAYRELAYFLAWRDVKVRYKQTIFGAAWAVIQPFLLFSFSGLVPWTLFATSVIGSSDSLVAAANLLQKVYFPRLLLPAAAIGSHLLDFFIAMVVLGALMLYFGVLPSVAVLWIIPLTALVVATALACGVWLSAINVRYRDVKHAVPFLVQVWLFASPVAYSTDFVPEQWRTIYYLNPMAGIIDGFRWALVGQGGAAPVGPVLVATAVTAVVLLLGLAYFRRVERTFADII
jgi:lipopolysaccharide transport system permease protein